MTLGEAPGGAQFIESLVGVIQTLALLYACSPDASALPHLESYIASINPAVAETIDAGPAAKLLKALRSAVMTEKHKLEATGIKSA